MAEATLGNSPRMPQGSGRCPRRPLPAAYIPPAAATRRANVATYAAGLWAKWVDNATAINALHAAWGAGDADADGGGGDHSGTDDGDDGYSHPFSHTSLGGTGTALVPVSTRVQRLPVAPQPNVLPGSLPTVLVVEESVVVAAAAGHQLPRHGRRLGASTASPDLRATMAKVAVPMAEVAKCWTF